MTDQLILAVSAVVLAPMLVASIISGFKDFMKRGTNR